VRIVVNPGTPGESPYEVVDVTFDADGRLACGASGPLNSCGGLYLDLSPGDVLALEVVSLTPPQDVLVGCMSVLTDDPESQVIACSSPTGAHVGVIFRPVLESLVPAAT
jgi:hypothetical protein